MLVKVEIDTWMELREMVWSGARDVVLEIREVRLAELENQGREEEALDILEELFSPGVWGSIPTETDINDYIWFDLADHMNLYGDEEEEEDEDDE